MEADKKSFSAAYTDNPALDFKDVSDEAWRQYTFSDGTKVRISGPKAVAISLSSVEPKIGAPQSHRIVDVDGQCHYIPAGWVQLTWKCLSGKKPCAF